MLLFITELLMNGLLFQFKCEVPIPILSSLTRIKITHVKIDFTFKSLFQNPNQGRKQDFVMSFFS